MPQVCNGKTYYGCWAGNERGTLQDPKRCIEEVSSRERFAHYSQCNFKKKVGDYCAIHDPAAVKARAKKSQDAYEADTESRRLGYEGSIMLKALITISAGCNDARTCAQEALDSLNRDRRTGLKKKDSDDE